MLEQSEFRELIYALRSVKQASLWNREMGLEYWLQPSLAAMGIGTFSDGLLAVASNGWVNTGTVVGVAGTGADFPLAAENTWTLAADKGTPAHFAIDTAGDLLNSPALFGDPTHMAVAAEMAGMKDLPTILQFDTWSAFDAGANEAASGLGFVEAGGAASVANDHMAAFFIDGTSIRLRSAAATSGILLAKDTALHRLRVRIDRIAQLAYAYIDDMATAKGSIAIQADLFPVSFGAGVLTSTGTNFIKLGPTRIRYAWHGW